MCLMGVSNKFPISIGQKKKKAEYSLSFVELKQKVPTLSKALAAMAPGSEISDM